MKSHLKNYSKTFKKIFEPQWEICYLTKDMMRALCDWRPRPATYEVTKNVNDAEKLVKNHVDKAKIEVGTN